MNSPSPTGRSVRMLAAASAPGLPDELAGQTAAAAAFVTARAPSTRRKLRHRTRRMTAGASLCAVLTIAISTGGAVAAVQGTLPEPVQELAHETLGTVGISVPSITNRSDKTPSAADHIDDDASTATPTPPPAVTPDTSSFDSVDGVAGLGTASAAGGRVANPDPSAPAVDPEPDHATLSWTFPDDLPAVPADPVGAPGPDHGPDHGPDGVGPGKPDPKAPKDDRKIEPTKHDDKTG